MLPTTILFYSILFDPDQNKLPTSRFPPSSPTLTGQPHLISIISSASQTNFIHPERSVVVSTPLRIDIHRYPPPPNQSHSSSPCLLKPSNEGGRKQAFRQSPGLTSGEVPSSIQYNPKDQQTCVVLETALEFVTIPYLNGFPLPL